MRQAAARGCRARALRACTCVRKKKGAPPFRPSFFVSMRIRRRAEKQQNETKHGKKKHKLLSLLPTEKEEREAAVRGTARPATQKRVGGSKGRSFWVFVGEGFLVCMWPAFASLGGRRMRVEHTRKAKDWSCGGASCILCRHRPEPPPNANAQHGCARMMHARARERAAPSLTSHKRRIFWVWGAQKGRRGVGGKRGQRAGVAGVCWWWWRSNGACRGVCVVCRCAEPTHEVARPRAAKMAFLGLEKEVFLSLCVEKWGF